MITKGQAVLLGNQRGIVLRRQGPHAVKVLTSRDKLIMAGTFPDKPIGSAVQSVVETWPIKSIKEIAL